MLAGAAFLLPLCGVLSWWGLAVAVALPGTRANDGLETPYNDTGWHHPLLEPPRPDSFLRFVHRQHRAYTAGSPEYERREHIFWASAQRQNLLNSMSVSSGGNNTAYYGINQFSDLSPGEFRATFLKSFASKSPRFAAKANHAVKPLPLPSRFDWRDKKVVTAVKDQQACGSCWAFSVVEAVESANAIDSQLLEELSVQQVVDCSQKDFGCSGGSPTSALRWLNETQEKLARNSEYIYKAKTGMCHYFPLSHFGVSIKGFEDYNFIDYEEEMMRKLISLGPLIVLVDAVSWQDYLGGIIQHHCSSSEPNHAVLVTGFDRSGDIPYWIVRNSWGASWGVGGYVYVKIGGNICGVADTVAATFV